MKTINVLALFDGGSIGRYCLEQAGFTIGKYYSSEIDKTALTISEDNYPDIVRLGDVTKISYVAGRLITENGIFPCGKIDIIFSGSPCTDMSIASSSREGLNGQYSSLFFEFVRILEEVRQDNPEVKFLQENVKGRAEDMYGISRALGVLPVRINSKLVSAQLRDRFYWSNIRTKKAGLFGELVTDIPQPKDRKIFLQDVLDADGIVISDRTKARAILANNDSKPITDKNKLFRRYKNGFGTVVFEPPEMTAENCRILTQSEMERLQTWPAGYTKSVNRNKAAHALGNGWTAEVIIHILSFWK